MPSSGSETFLLKRYRRTIRRTRVGMMEPIDPDSTVAALSSREMTVTITPRYQNMLHPLKKPMEMTSRNRPRIREEPPNSDRSSSLMSISNSIPPSDRAAAARNTSATRR